MTKTVISVENLSKTYTLGTIGTGTFSHDLAVWWARVRGKPNPLLRIGETDHGNRVGEEIWALKDVSFQVQQGEVLGVIGRNGAGKSTLLKILSRVTAPTSGEVKVKGRIASLLEVGTGFHPELTGRENIYLNGAILGMTKQEVTRKFDEIVDFSGVEKFIDTPVKRYSSGMYVRLAFAVAAHLESEILLVDEVLAVGDAEFQKKCLGKMGDVAHNEGRTVLFVSHNMAAIQQLCSNAIWIDKGNVKSMDYPIHIISQYQAGNILADPNSINHFESASMLINKIEFLDRNEKKVNSINSGDDLLIDITLNAKKELYDFHLGIGINSEQNIRVVTIHTSLMGEKFDLHPGVSKIRCTINSIVLTEGLYFFDFKFYGNGKSDLIIENCYKFRVNFGNYFNSGKIPSSQLGGLIYLQHTWKIN